MATGPTPNLPEYKLNPVNPGSVSKLLTCSLCLSLARVPVQTNCGCRFCLRCILEYLRVRDPANCPNKLEDCLMVSNNIPEFVFRRDPGAEKEIRPIVVHCPNSDCKFEVRVSDIENHLSSECQFTKDSCPTCNELVFVKNFEQHQASECKSRKVECPLCKETFTHSNYKNNHLNLLSSECCGRFTAGCPYCKEGEFTSRTLPAHSTNCKKWERKCDFNLVGCTFRGDIESLQLHQKRGVFKHLKLISKITRHQTSKIKSLCDDYSALKLLIEDLKTEIELAKLSCQETQVVILEFIPSLSSPSETLGSAAPLVRTTYPNSRSNGKFFWKIPDYRRKKQEPPIDSAPFYTNQFGYKMCLRTYLNGDGSGANSHISIFLVIMRGEYDDLLSWPFKQKVTLSVLDQDGHQHISDTFRPDITSDCYRQPQGNMNTASGCPRLASHIVVEGNLSSSRYLKDDTIFIRATVDISNLTHP